MRHSKDTTRRIRIYREVALRWEQPITPYVAITLQADKPNGAFALSKFVRIRTVTGDGYLKGQPLTYFVWNGKRFLQVVVFSNNGFFI